MDKLLLLSFSPPMSYKCTLKAALTTFYPGKVQSNQVAYSKLFFFFVGTVCENIVKQIQTRQENNSGLNSRCLFMQSS